MLQLHMIFEVAFLPEHTATQLAGPALMVAVHVHHVTFDVLEESGADRTTVLSLHGQQGGGHHLEAQTASVRSRGHREDLHSIPGTGAKAGCHITSDSGWAGATSNHWDCSPFLGW